tara:strand:- start:654 stop:2348 length:1695 start_codon:yes stop_codon:yes gene_type:complete
MYKNFLSLLNENQKKRFPFLITLYGLGSIIEVVTLASFVPFLNSIRAPKLIQENDFIFGIASFFNISSSIEIIKFLGLISFSLFLFSAFFRTIVLHITNKFIESIRHSLCTRIFTDHLNKDYDEASNINTYELSKVMLSEVDQVIMNIVRPAFNLSSHSFLVVGITLLLIVTYTKVAFISITFFLTIYFFVFSFIRKKLNDLGKIRADTNENRFNFVTESLNGLKEIKIFRAIKATAENFINSSKKFAESQALAATLSLVPNYIIEAAAFGGIILITIFNLNISDSSNPTLGESFSMLGLFAISFYRIKPSAQSIYQAFSLFKFGEKALENVLSKISSVHVFDDLLEIAFEEKICFENVSFGYDKNKENVIDNLKFEINKGDKVFIQGDSGSGKSTILEIICGLRQPTSGVLLVDDIALQTKHFNSWVGYIGFVPQDTFLLNRTLIENIAFGENTNEIKMKKILEVTEIVEMKEVIDQLPKKLNSIVGERGKTFSGGQKQRIGIARALYKNPDLLIFDEATSALDSNTEKLVLKNIIENYKEKTLVVVSHNSDLKDLFNRVIYV